MQAYLIRRAILSVLVIALLMALLFFATHILGDPIRLMLPSDAPQDQYEAMKEAYGYNRPLHVQFFDFYGDVLRGDFGASVRHKLPALSTVLDRLPNTAILAAAAILISLLGIPLGMLAATKPRGMADKIVNVVSFAGISTPEFWVGLMLIMVVAVEFRLLPTSGFGGLTGWKYLILPAITLAPNPLGRFAQITRAAMVEEMGKQYVSTARAKGLAESTVMWVHVFKNAAIPIVTLGGDQIASFMNGATVVETVFGWPGLGLLIIEAITSRDLPIVTAATFFVVLMVMSINLLVDIIYTWLDPRVRYQ